MKFIVFILALLQLHTVFAQAPSETYFCNEELGKLPILQGGRIKPLSVHAKESIKHLVGKSKVGDYKATTAYCLLSAQGFGLPVNLNATTTIDHSQTREFLGGKHEMPLSELVSMQGELRSEWMRQKDEGSYKKDLGKLLSKISLYSEITSSNNWLLPMANGTEMTWIPLASFLTQEKIESLAKISQTPFLYAFEEAKKEYIQVEGDKYLVEYYFDKASLTGWAMLTTILALAALVLFKRFYISLGLSVLTVLIQLTYLGLRVYISERAPITNMYETVIFSGFGSLLLALIIGHFKKEKVFIYMGLAYNLCTLMMITFAGSMVSPSISPLVPVLRDNFWLSTHVTTIIMSYGALALSWILANTIIIKKKFGHLTHKDEVYYNDVIYTSLKYGVTMLAAGIILGGVWADYSWGRFWGWDPKETWSLIVLCFYMAILHGKYTNWIPPKRFAPLVAAAFMSVMMAWFGVNYILASGLHSYGFSEGGAIFLGSFFAVQLIILGITIKSEPKQVA
ncbi:cytochrome c biogenesis protein [Bacteriovorax sp. Seq25_V]|uniref:cytochrome c biogenesis protein n=1 Tax=Bacteriovorax sp. Seq25_V TaxID=1201288 RepID=UPI00038A0F2D|nr:cytochrome c biogenesis protein CcsA [Bacteriovorax sp. Seq25_V]EQC48040.1 putative cytochrome c-type biogenesis protein CcsB [Bacteriovorax sp. Seq25_V]